MNFHRLVCRTLFGTALACLSLIGESIGNGAGALNPVASARAAENFSPLGRGPVAPATGAASSLVADYQFRDSLISSVGSAPALTHLGSNAFESAAVDDSPRRVLQFDPNNGVALAPTAGTISNQSYTIVILFSFSNTSGYRRILDFKNGASDTGLYISDDGFPPNASVVFKSSQFRNFFGRDRVFRPNAVTQLAITRDREGNVGVYVGGLRQLSFVDRESDAVISASNTLRFFRDNAGDSESSAGFVARIRIFNTVLSGNDIAGLDRLPNAQAGCPSVSGLTPNNGQPGTTFAIMGTGLSGVTAVNFPNDVAAPFTINDDTQLSVTEHLAPPLQILRSGMILTSPPN